MTVLPSEISPYHGKQDYYYFFYHLRQSYSIAILPVCPKLHTISTRLTNYHLETTPKNTYCDYRTMILSLNKHQSAINSINPQLHCSTSIFWFSAFYQSMLMNNCEKNDNSNRKKMLTTDSGNKGHFKVNTHKSIRVNFTIIPQIKNYNTTTSTTSPVPTNVDCL